MDHDEEQFCKVMDKNDHFTGFVQILLAFLALSSLYVKRKFEVPRRKARTFWLDIGKLAAGDVYDHILNMIIAADLTEYVRGDARNFRDQCAWFGANFLIDTTAGLVISVTLLRMFTKLAISREWKTLSVPGVYEGPDGNRIWIHQVIAWIGILTITKVILLFFLWAISPILVVIAGYLFRPLEEHIRFELLFVMIVFPGLINVLYFWVADGYLKATPDHPEAHEEGYEVEYSGSDCMYVQFEGQVLQLTYPCCPPYPYMQHPSLTTNNLQTESGEVTFSEAPTSNKQNQLVGLFNETLYPQTLAASHSSDLSIKDDIILNKISADHPVSQVIFPEAINQPYTGTERDLPSIV